MAVIIMLMPMSSCMRINMPGPSFSDESGEIMALMDKGDMLKAAEIADEKASQFESIGQSENQAKYLAICSEALNSAGYTSRALEKIEKAISLSRGPSKADFFLLKGIILTNRIKTDEAGSCLEKSMDMAKKTRNLRLEASILNCLGNLYSITGNNEKALVSYQESADMAKGENDARTASNALINAARLLVETGDHEKAIRTMDEAASMTHRVNGNREKVYSLLSLCDLSMKVWIDGKGLAKDAGMKGKIIELLDESFEIASKTKNDLALSYTLGSMAKYHEMTDNPEHALDLTYRALIKAQAAESSDSLLKLHWQAARLLNKAGKTDAAISEFEKTVYYIKKTASDISDDCRSGRSSYKDLVGPAYLEYVDLMLKKSSASRDGAEKNRLLLKTLSILENLKAAEIQDYFKDGCITAMGKKIASSDSLSENTAVFYPLILKDRTELILSTKGEIIQATTPVDSKKITETINNFRSRLEDPGNDYYQKDAEKLYAWLISPIEKYLLEKQIKIMVIIPDGPIRNIPMAALNDGRSFLIEKYSIVTTPGLTLTDPNALAKNRIKLLMAGLTESVQGFTALPSVALETDYIKNNFEGEILQNRTFTSSNLENMVDKKPYTIVHIATHGQFDRDPSKTFLLTFDGKLTLDDLDRLIKPSKYSENPVELLTLSACQTAAGDDRAALGLAGVAIKSGARSALASLWFIDDEATSRLITRFYDELKKSDSSKAKAMQTAQISILKEKKYSHPAFWSPFLIIGNWL